MEIYLVGKVITIGKTYIIFESRYCGEIIYVPIPESFILNKIQKIYILKYQKNDRKFLYGFNSFKERCLFANLLNISSIGPKMAFNLLKIGFETAIRWIINRNIDKIAKLPLWNDKSAKQTCWELSEKYSEWYHHFTTKNNNKPQCQKQFLEQENNQKNFNKFNGHSDF